MGSRIAHFLGGTASARQKLNDMSDICNSVADLRGDERGIITVARSLAGYAITLNIGQLIQYLPKLVAPPANITFIKGTVTGLFNDYVIVSSSVGNVAVAKPDLLRHIVTNYPQLTVITTVSDQDMKVQDNAGQEEWITLPAYTMGSVIDFFAWTTTVVDAAGHPVVYKDSNNDARRWNIK